MKTKDMTEEEIKQVGEIAEKIANDPTHGLSAHGKIGYLDDIEVNKTYFVARKHGDEYRKSIGLVGMKELILEQVKFWR